MKGKNPRYKNSKSRDSGTGWVDHDLPGSYRQVWRTEKGDMGGKSAVFGERSEGRLLKGFRLC